MGGRRAHTLREAVCCDVRPISGGGADGSRARHRNWSDAGMTPKPARFVTVLALPLVLLVFATPARSQEEHPTFAKVGAYVGVSGLLDFTLDGLSFDGTSYYKQVDGE